MTKTENEQHTDKVKLRLPVSREHSEDVFVGINGHTWQIRRGVTVEVPQCVANVLERSERMQQAAMEFEAKAAAPLAELAEV